MKYVNYFEKIQQAAKLSEDGKSGDAINNYLDAIEIAPKVEDKLEPLYSLGLEFKEDNPEDSIVYFNKCAELAKSYEKSFYYCYYYNSEKELGDLYMSLKEFPKALLHYKKAYKDIKKFDDDPDTEKYLNKMIKTMEKKGA